VLPAKFEAKIDFNFIIVSLRLLLSAVTACSQNTGEQTAAWGLTVASHVVQLPIIKFVIGALSIATSDFAPRHAMPSI
jgi:hypothetical protein